jgi:hypothetical protein
MNERTALTLVFAISMIAVLLALPILSMLGASSEQQAIAFVLILLVSADAGARAVLKDRR